MFVAVVMGTATFSVLVAILVIYIHSKGSRTPVPCCMRTIFLRGLARAFCMHDVVRHTEKEMDSGCTATLAAIDSCEASNPNCNDVVNLPDQNQQYLELVEIRKLLKGLSDKLEDKEKENTVEEEWRDVSKVVDRLCFIICLIVIICALSGILLML